MGLNQLNLVEFSKKVTNKFVVLFLLIQIAVPSAYSIELKPGIAVDEIMSFSNDEITLKLITDRKMKALVVNSMISLNPSGNYDENLTREYLKYFWFEGLSELGPKKSVLDSIFDSVEGDVQNNRKMIHHQVSESDHLTYAAFEGNTLVGNIAVQEEEPSRVRGQRRMRRANLHSLAIFITHANSGRGLGKKVARCMLKLIKEKLDVSELVWRCRHDNVASIKLAIILGFENHKSVLIRGFPWDYYQLDLAR